MVNDVARAFFEADATRPIAVEIPQECRTKEDEQNDMVAVLKESLYGTRDAAMNPQREVQKPMKGCGFEVGLYNVCTFYNKEKCLKTMVHGDDFSTVGSREHAGWFGE